jgi:hypothetical protein
MRPDLRHFVPLLLATGLTAVAVITVNACGTATTCGPGNCVGCCSAQGQCELGNAATACGANGGTCDSCTGGAHCVAAVCVPPTGSTDAGGDAGPPDAGIETDAGDPMDAGADAGVDPDAGTGDAGTGDAGTQDAGALDAGAADAGGNQGVTCGALTCTAGEVCCVEFSAGSPTYACAVTCPGGSGTVACDGPEDCGGATPHCCGDLVTGPGNPPSCPIQSINAACTATCQPNVPLSCDSQATVAPCHEKAHCAPYGSYSECCSFTQNGSTATFCVTTFRASFANGGCHP